MRANTYYHELLAHRLTMRKVAHETIYLAVLQDANSLDIEIIDAEWSRAELLPTNRLVYEWLLLQLSTTARIQPIHETAEWLDAELFHVELVQLQLFSVESVLRNRLSMLLLNAMRPTL